MARLVEIFVTFRGPSSLSDEGLLLFFFLFSVGSAEQPLLFDLLENFRQIFSQSAATTGARSFACLTVR